MHFLLLSLDLLYETNTHLTLFSCNFFSPLTSSLFSARYFDVFYRSEVMASFRQEFMDDNELHGEMMQMAEKLEKTENI